MSKHSIEGDFLGKILEEANQKRVVPYKIPRLGVEKDIRPRVSVRQKEEKRDAILKSTQQRISDFNDYMSSSERNEKLRHFYFSARALGFLSIEIIQDMRDVLLFSKDLLVSPKKRREVVEFLQSITAEDLARLLANVPSKMKAEYERIIALPREEFMTEGPILMYKMALTGMMMRDVLKGGTGKKLTLKKGENDAFKFGSVATEVAVNGANELDQASENHQNQKK